MKLTVEQAENGYIVTDETGKRWIALESEYQSTYELKLERVLMCVLGTTEPEPLKVAA